MLPIISSLATFIRHHLQEVCFGITTIVMVLCGPYINSTVKRLAKDMHWLIRFVIFLFLCCVGYAFLSHMLFQILKKWFIHFNNLTLVIVTIASYLLLAWFAKQQKEI